MSYKIHIFYKGFFKNFTKLKFEKFLRMKSSKDNEVQIIDCEDVPQQQQVNYSKQNMRPQPLQINSLSALKQSQDYQSKNFSKQIQPQVSKDFSVSDMISEPSMERSEIVFLTNQRSKKMFRKNQDNQEYLQFQGDNDNSPQKLKRKDKNTQDKKISLMQPPQIIYHKAYQNLDKTYLSLIGNHFSFSTLQNFVNQPLASLQQTNYMRYIFQIHSYNFQFTFHSYYEFYLRNSQGEMINIMRAQKQSLTVSSAYQILAVNPNDLKSKQFTAKLKYNTLKSEYNLYDIDEKIHQKMPRNILATVLYDKAFGQNRQLQMYRPKDQYRMKGEFVKSPLVKNLSQLYDQLQSPMSRKIQKLKTVGIQKIDQEIVREQFQLKKQGRKILLQDENDEQKFYMGKKQDGRYIILAGSGLTPLQVFMLAIVNLQH